MTHYQFSFGPNKAYFVNTDSAFAYSEHLIPDGLVRVIEEVGGKNPRKLEMPYNVAFPMEPGFYTLSWTTEDSIYEDVCLGSNYERLARFTEKVTAASQSTMRTVFGPWHSYFSMSPSGYSWQNLSPELEDEIHNNIRKREPLVVALGVSGTYIVLYNDGTVKSNLGGQYPLVEALMADRERTVQRRGMMYIALNPFVAGEFYAVYGDGSTSWNVPTAWEEDLATISKYIEPLPEVASTKPEQVRPATPRKSHWNKEKIEQGLKLVEAAVGVTEILQNLQELL